MSTTIDQRKTVEDVENLWADMSQGIAHLAFVTDDMAATMEFWTKVMKMQLVAVKRIPSDLDAAAADRGEPPHPHVRHYFFNMGKDQMVAFFEYPKDAKIPTADRDHLGGMQHVAFHLHPDRFHEMCKHVQSCGLDVRGPVPIGECTQAFYFYDNNGMRIEFNTYRDDSPRAGNVGPALNTREDARAELGSLLDDPAEVESWLTKMPFEK